MIEIFKLSMPDHLLIFITVKTDHRFNTLVSSLNVLHVKTVGPRCLAVNRRNATHEEIRNTLGDLIEGECVYVVDTASHAIDNYLLVPTRMEGGIIVK